MPVECSVGSSSVCGAGRACPLQRVLPAARCWAPVPALALFRQGLIQARIYLVSPSCRSLEGSAWDQPRGEQGAATGHCGIRVCPVFMLRSSNSPFSSSVVPAPASQPRFLAHEISGIISALVRVAFRRADPDPSCPGGCRVLVEVCGWCREGTQSRCPKRFRYL